LQRPRSAATPGSPGIAAAPPPDPP
jgi:hypothetical protein